MQLPNEKNVQILHYMVMTISSQFKFYMKRQVTGFQNYRVHIVLTPLIKSAELINQSCQLVGQIWRGEKKNPGFPEDERIVNPSKFSNLNSF